MKKKKVEATYQRMVRLTRELVVFAECLEEELPDGDVEELLQSVETIDEKVTEMRRRLTLLAIHGIYQIVVPLAPATQHGSFIDEEPEEFKAVRP